MDAHHIVICVGLFLSLSSTANGQEEQSNEPAQEKPLCCAKLADGTFSDHCQKTKLWAGSIEGSATTPNFPNRFPILKKCVWEIYTRPKSRIRLDFRDFYLIGPGDDGVCYSQNVIVTAPLSGRKVGPHCGNAGIPSVVSAGNIPTVIEFDKPERKDDYEEPVLSPMVIVGVAAGGIVVIAFAVTFATKLLHQRRSRDRLKNVDNSENPDRKQGPEAQPSTEYFVYYYEDPKTQRTGQRKKKSRPDKYKTRKVEESGKNGDKFGKNEKFNSLAETHGSALPLSVNPPNRCPAMLAKKTKSKESKRRPGSAVADKEKSAKRRKYASVHHNTFNKSTHKKKSRTADNSKNPE